ncbi:MAG: nucleotidyl transferase AbiEii/AbiGii toxin family protein [Cytophagales bacterium]|nr:nucleotidyl transferase AbiEii/AbiGii toxin family protein [Cytophagales bacterium]MCA6370759.1 nucleotidyl transferase AbiEii/AbiGii toxin family protein [Cytophagales bacterium]MCA6385921.1 nucleotidyl transferase AbiEii/AbiGii toxin family protein [Cytophagales bacterium]
MGLHYKTVKPELLQLIKRICSDPFFNSYRLVGGTSLSLQIGHRGSVDADFFSDGHGQPVPELLKYVYPNIIRKMGKVEEANGCMGLTDNGLKLDVFDYGDPFIKPSKIVDGIRMASLLDIGLMKLDVQNRRSAWKDLIDLNAITDIHPLTELLSVYNLRYPPLPVKQCYMSLVKNLENPPSIDQFPFELMFNSSTPDSIISSLKKKSVEVYQSILRQQTKEARINVKSPVSEKQSRIGIDDINASETDRKNSVKLKDGGISM